MTDQSQAGENRVKVGYNKVLVDALLRLASESKRPAAALVREWINSFRPARVNVETVSQFLVRGERKALRLDIGSEQDARLEALQAFFPNMSLQGIVTEIVGIKLQSMGRLLQIENGWLAKGSPTEKRSKTRSVGMARDSSVVIPFQRTLKTLGVFADAVAEVGLRRLRISLEAGTANFEHRTMRSEESIFSVNLGPDGMVELRAIQRLVKLSTGQLPSMSSVMLQALPLGIDAFAPQVEQALAAQAAERTANDSGLC